MIAHKEAVLRGDEGLANDLQGSTHIQGIGLMHAHPWILIKTGVFARSFAGFHELSSSLSSAKNRGLAATKSGGWSRRDRGGVVSGGAPCGQYISNRKKGESRRQRMALSVILQRERCQVQQSRKDQPSDVQSTLPGTN